MPSFQITISPKRRAAARFISSVRTKLIKALEEEKQRRGLTQSEVARQIEVHRSVVSRELRGRADLSLGRVAELAWALGKEPSFELREPVDSGNGEALASQFIATSVAVSGDVTSRSGGEFNVTTGSL